MNIKWIYEASPSGDVMKRSAEFIDQTKYEKVLILLFSLLFQILMNVPSTPTNAPRLRPVGTL